AADDGQTPRRTTNARLVDSGELILRQVEDKWTDAWNGRNGAYTVQSSSPVFAPTVPRPGVLMLASLTGARTSKVGDGDYQYVSASPDGRRFAALRAAEDIPDALSPVGGRTELQIFEIREGVAREVAQLRDFDVGIGPLVWSADGKRILLGGKRTGEKRSAVG